MIYKTKEKQKAIALRKRGLSYNEILRKVPVAKSTLSLWLRDIGLAKQQKQRLTEKRRKAQTKAQQACRSKRIKITEEIKFLARKEVNGITKKDLWLIGIILYWAEGSKQKETNVSERVTLGNSDPNIIKIFLRWLNEVCKIDKKDIVVRLAIHETSNKQKAKKYWSKITNIPASRFHKTLIKKHNIKTNRKFNDNYEGLLFVTVKKSTNLNRKIAGWIEGITENLN